MCLGKVLFIDRQTFGARKCPAKLYCLREALEVFCLHSLETMRLRTMGYVALERDEIQVLT